MLGWLDASIGSRSHLGSYGPLCSGSGLCSQGTCGNAATESAGDTDETNRRGASRRKAGDAQAGADGGKAPDHTDTYDRR